MKCSDYAGRGGQQNALKTKGLRLRAQAGFLPRELSAKCPENKGIETIKLKAIVADPGAYQGDWKPLQGSVVC